MNRMIAAIALVAAVAAPLRAQQPDLDRYVRQTYRTTDIPADAQPMIDELRAEVQKVLDAGPLAPLRAVYADIKEDMYYLYWQPGRIVTTLAYAYPYLAPEQQEAVKAYVRAELDDPARAPWAPDGHLPAAGGARREIHSYVHEGNGWDRYWGMWGVKKPITGVIYGLWLYADRTGDWDTIERHYDDLARFYAKNVNAADLYGTMGAHIAMARIARHHGDERTARLAENAAEASLRAGLDFDEIETRTQKYYAERYHERVRPRIHMGWMFLELSPEVGRFLAENVREPVLARNREGVTAYPLFWLREASYGPRWTGDEGKGIPTEMMGMVVPVERWVGQVPAAQLAGYMRSTPICIGDCYWLESLVHAIEASGTTTWEPVE